MVSQIEKVKQKIQQEIRTGNRLIDGSLDYASEESGKMIRSRLLLLGASFGKSKNKKKQDQIIELAAAVETLHLATLIHDDIIDEAKLRRGRESVQSRYSKEYALYMGDYLLSRSILMMGQMGMDAAVYLRVAKAVNQICVGEMKQHHYRYRTDVSVMQYLRVVSGKTAALFSISLSAGAYYTKADQGICKTLARIGYELGMAFQLVDDLLDYIGQEEVVGKELEKDILEGYYNIPVLFALSEKNDRAKELEMFLQDHESLLENKQSIMEVIKSSQAIDKTRELALRYHQRAEKLIQSLPESEEKKEIDRISSQLIHRVY